MGGGGGGGGGGLPKARINKFMKFNGGMCSPYSFRPPGGGGGGGFKKLHRAVFYGDRSKLFWMSLYKLITVYTRAISQAKNNNYTVVWLVGHMPILDPIFSSVKFSTLMQSKAAFRFGEYLTNLLISKATSNAPCKPLTASLHVLPQGSTHDHSNVSILFSSPYWQVG